MRTFLRSKVRLLFMTCAVLLAIPAIALADNITNNLDASVDSTAEVMTLQVGATSGNTTQLSVIPTGSGPTPADGKSGCNITGSTTVTFPVSSSNPAVATVNPNSVTFTSCGVIRTLTVTPLAQGSTTISLGAPTSNNTGGTFDTAPATFTVNVTPPPPSNTPPQVSVQGVTEGAFYEKGSVPSATCQVTDVEDGNSSFAATINSSQLNQYGLGQQTASCSYTDNGGLSASSSKTYSIQDTTPPSIAPHENVSANAANAQGAVVNYTNPTANDAVYGPVAVVCLPASGSTFPLGDTTVTCTATDGSGNTATSTFKVTVSDATPPVITHEIQGTLGNNGWYTSAVDLTWSVTDPESPNSISKTGCADQHITSDQGPTTYSCSATSAGGSAGPETVTIKRDATPPNVTLGAASGTNGDNGWYKSAVTQTFNASDATSGLADPDQDPSFTKSSGANEEGDNVSIPSGPVSDNAGNTASASAGPFKIDLTDPTIEASLDPEDPAVSGWYNAATGPPTVSFQCSDSVSGLEANACPADHTFANGENQSHSGTVTDRAGRSATAGVNDVDVDLDPPNAPNATTDPLNPVADSGGFFKDSVKVSYGGSTDVGPSLVKGYTDAQTFDTTNTHNYSGTATDNAGNESTATTGQVKVDAGDPTVAISGCPTNSVVLNSTQNITVSANDDTNGSGLVSNPSSPVSLDTSSVGSKSKTITVEDKVGHTKSATCNYSVKYDFGGFLQPINYTAHQVLDTNVSTFKGGSTVPVKFQLKDATGKVVQSASAPQWLTPQKGSATNQAVDETVFTEPATSGTLYKWDGTQYHYNWSTKGVTAGFYYKIGVKLDDGQTYYTYISLR